MRRINYPTDASLLASFETEYFSGLKLDAAKINSHLAKIPGLPKGFDLSALVTLKFEDLLKYQAKIGAYSDAKNKTTKGKKGKPINEFADLFDYKSNQQNIAKFFMNQPNFQLGVCHYCNIDYINAFADLDDFNSPIDFINRANLYELQAIEDLGVKQAQKIIDGRKSYRYTDLNQTVLSKKIKDRISKMIFKNSHNHFTLDHIIPQKTHKFLSLCLYNFVPACYSCNSKFKKDLDFSINEHLDRISPTSAKYSFSEDFQFGILFSGDVRNIKTVSDFRICRKIKRNKAHIERYISMFKISGRYVYHKSIALDLITKKIQYPDSRIRELAKKLGVSPLDFKAEKFGNELFDPKIENEPFIKFKRDIAKSIGIKGVV